MSRRRRWVVAIGVVLAVAGASHVGAVVASPQVVMRVAEGRIADRAGGENRWLHQARVTPANQEVVRSSPDLAYSACVWDLTDGPVTITAPGWDDYFSLSLYDRRTDNFYIANDRSDPDGVVVLLATEDQARRADVTPGIEVVQAPSTTGVALLRYLAPTPTSFAAADRVRRAAVCE